MSQIVVAEQNTRLRYQLIEKLHDIGLLISGSGDEDEILALVSEESCRLLVLGGMWSNTLSGLDFLFRIRVVRKQMPVVIVVSKTTNEAMLIGLIKNGVNDFYKIPFSNRDFLNGVIQKLNDQKITFQGNCSSVDEGNLLLGDSRIFQETKAYLSNVARAESNVLIYGETGVGKEVTTEYIHKNSRRRDKELVCLNCAALPETLVESELFGYERGAFTGAASASPGKFELADEGILFLDEIGDMSLQAQAKLLRIIESNEVYRLGGKKPKNINTRVIAATNQDPEYLVSAGKFRPDLYYRLNVARVNIPPLRERKGDIAALIEHFVQQYNDEFDCYVKDFSQKAWASLLSYEWPGNIRELKNTIEATYINRPANTIRYEDLPQSFRKQVEQMRPTPLDERSKLLSVLLSTNWNKSKTAEKMKWSRMTVYRKMDKYSIIENREPRKVYRLSRSSIPPEMTSLSSKY